MDLNNNTIQDYKAIIETLKGISFNCNVVVSCSNDKPIIELRKCIHNFDIIKQVVSCAYHRVPILILPEFKDTLKSLCSLVDKGILTIQDNKYYFTF